MGLENLVTLVKGLAEGRLGLVQLTSHTGIWGALTGEEKGDSRDLFPCPALAPAGCLLTGSNGCQAFTHLEIDFAHHTEPMLEV